MGIVHVPTCLPHAQSLVVSAVWLVVECLLFMILLPVHSQWCRSFPKSVTEMTSYTPRRIFACRVWL